MAATRTPGFFPSLGQLRNDTSSVRTKQVESNSQNSMANTSRPYNSSQFQSQLLNQIRNDTVCAMNTVRKTSDKITSLENERLTTLENKIDKISEMLVQVQNAVMSISCDLSKDNTSIESTSDEESRLTLADLKSRLNLTQFDLHNVDPLITELRYLL